MADITYPHCEHCQTSGIFMSTRVCMSRTGHHRAPCQKMNCPGSLRALPPPRP